MEDKQQSIFKFAFDETSKEHIKGISQWASINAIVSLVALGINIIQFVMASGSAYRSSSFNFAMRSENGTSLFIQTAISILMNVTLFTASTKLKKGLEATNQGMLGQGFLNLRNYYKIYGIVLIVVLVLGILGILLVSSFRRY